ncbi:MAG: hypothetical protein OEZ33_08115, partial [Gammaproteobacteria bacterium]|nr:hypothetical protein [Gammaproteobacteria bacterium]
AEKMLKSEDVATLSAEIDKIQRNDQKEALSRLIQNGKVSSVDDDVLLRGVVNGKMLSKDATNILKNAHKSVWHTAKKVKKFRQWITWLFAFGLVGLGMQITVSSMKQAGGQPAVIGGIVGFTKAVLSLIVVMVLIKDTI